MKITTEMKKGKDLKKLQQHKIKKELKNYR